MKIKGRKIVKTAFKGIKATVMTNQTERTKHADTIVRNHVIWSMGAGLIPVLIADIFAVSALQLDMIRQLCKVYDVDFAETQGKAIVTSLTSSTLARIGAGSLVKLIPGFGSILGGVSVSIFAGASTYALGEVFKRHFESGGTILDFDPDRLRKLYREKFEKGKQMAKEWRKENEEAEDAEGGFTVKEETPAPKAAGKPEPTKSSDMIEKLKSLAELKENGIITDEEFQKMKQRIIDSM